MTSLRIRLFLLVAAATAIVWALAAAWTVLSARADVEAIIHEAGRKTGDLVHALPFAPEFYRGEFKSHIADMRNSVTNRANAQASCAAEFVHWHMDGTDAKWAHIDMAYPAMRGGRATGYGVALLAQAVRDLA